jgi:hypothetical protein
MTHGEPTGSGAWCLAEFDVLCDLSEQKTAANAEALP